MEEETLFESTLHCIKQWILSMWIVIFKEILENDSCYTLSFLSRNILLLPIHPLFASPFNFWILSYLYLDRYTVIEFLYNDEKKKKKRKKWRVIRLSQKSKKDWETLFLETSNRGIVLLILKIASRRARVVIVLSKRPLINP